MEKSERVIGSKGRFGNGIRETAIVRFLPFGNSLYFCFETRREFAPDARRLAASLTDFVPTKFFTTFEGDWIQETRSNSSGEKVINSQPYFKESERNADSFFLSLQRRLLLHFGSRGRFRLTLCKSRFLRFLKGYFDRSLGLKLKI